MMAAKPFPAAALRPGFSRPCRRGPRAQDAPQRPIKRAPSGTDSDGSSRSATSRRRLLQFAALPPASGCMACSAAAQQPGRNAAMDQMFAAAMATGMAEYEESIAPVKRQLFDELLGGLPASAGGAGGEPAQLLELGIGTGPNMSYYSHFYGLTPTIDAAAGAPAPAAAAPPAAAGASQQQHLSQELPPLHITGIDPNNYMQPFLQQSLAASGWPQERLSWVAGRAEALPLEDDSQDAVVCTLVLCSVESVQPVLAEVCRVLKPGGALLFIEHTSARLEAQPLLWVGQRALQPLQRWLADNCHLTRDPEDAIRESFQGGVEARRFSVEGSSLIAPHVAGIARRQGGA